MELGTFGAVLKSAMDFESKVIAFYESTVDATKNPDLSNLFLTLLQRGQKRIQTLKRIRRENTTEMILEPITGFDSETYDPEISIPAEADERTIQEIAITIEMKLRDFYTAASIKISFLSEVVYAFEQLADENNDAASRLDAGSKD